MVGLVGFGQLSRFQSSPTLLRATHIWRKQTLDRDRRRKAEVRNQRAEVKSHARASVNRKDRPRSFVVTSWQLNMSSKLTIPTNENEQPTVRRAQIPPDLNFETMSELGRDLIQLSREIEAAGQVLTSEEELEQELARRRGGYMANGDS